MPRRPRLLYLAYYFRPANFSGCVRAWNTAVHLRRLNWDVSVVTLDPSLWRSAEPLERAAAEIEQAGLQQIFTGHSWQLLNPALLRCRDRGVGRWIGGACRILARRLDISPEAGWRAACTRACRNLLPGDVDLILATGSPYNSFEIAQALTFRLGCPYVLDYRDPWTAGNPHALEPTWLSERIKNKERRVLASAAAVTIVSPAWAAILNDAFSVGSKLHVVSNGYDPQEVQQVKPYDFGHFAIVYTGIFYLPLRAITPVMAALRRLQETAEQPLPDWRLHYYGPQNAHVREAAEQNGLGSRVVLHGVVPRREALAAVKGAAMSVVIASIEPTSTPAERGIVTGKIFESIGLGTPVLVVAPADSDLEPLLQTTGLGRRFCGNEIEAMAAYLSDAMRGVKPAAKDPEAYSWRNIGKQMDTVLRSALATAGPSSALQSTSAR